MLYVANSVIFSFYDDENENNNNGNNIKLQIRHADQVMQIKWNNPLAPPQRSYANVVPNNQIKSSNQHSILLNSTTDKNEKLTREEVASTKKKIEVALAGKKIHFNAVKLRATNKGEIAVDLSSKDEIKAAINQLNEITGIIDTIQKT